MLTVYWLKCLFVLPGRDTVHLGRVAAYQICAFSGINLRLGSREHTQVTGYCPLHGQHVSTAAAAVPDHQIKGAAPLSHPMTSQVLLTTVTNPFSSSNLWSCCHL